MRLWNDNIYVRVFPIGYLGSYKCNRKELNSLIGYPEAYVVQSITRIANISTSFKNWYEKTHYNKYQSIRTGYDTKSNKVPKSFNFERLPSSTVADKYMETVPNPKYYKLKRLRIGNWTLDGRKLNNAEIEELQHSIERLRGDLRSANKKPPPTDFCGGGFYKFNL
jgi:hypothetical protein